MVKFEILCILILFNLFRLFPNISGTSPGERCYHAAINLENSEMIVFGGHKSMLTA